eukprot:GHVS01095850.1.p1 GENE.GHVS01095850.1~~GHVS01095850.1.p1  ORF type:complete len:314 (+),score=37.15 GHVS01095850.1:156-1097(+)
MLQSSRLCLVLVSAFCWTCIHQLLQERLVLLLVPQAVRRAIQAHKAEDVRILSPANATAVLHAVIVGLPSLIIGTRLFAEDPWESESPVFDVIAIIMLGYFVWDVCVCLQHLSHYGTAFLLHGLLSLVGLYVQVTSSRCRLLGFATLFSASEISTPFLHCRWYCIKAKQTHTTYFSVVNFLFLSTFLLVRVLYLPIFIFPVYWFDCLFTQAHSHNMSVARRYLQFTITMVWSLLNFYWAFLLLGSQMHQWSRQKREERKARDKKNGLAEPTKSVEGGDAGDDASEEDSEGYADPRALTRRWSKRMCSSAQMED